MHRSSFAGMCGLTALAILLTALTLAPQAVTPTARAADSSTYTVALSPEPDTLDPQRTGTAAAATILQYVGDELVALSPRNTIVPDLARSYSISRDGLTYTFNLRQDVSFQDGTPLDAAAYVATFKRLLDPATKAAVQAGRLGDVSTIKTISRYSFFIKLKSPYAFLLYQLTDSNFIPLSPTALKAEGAGFGRKPVSTGPWQVDSWQSGSQIVLVRNPHYAWGPSFVQKGPPRISRLVFRVLLNDAAATDALQSSEVDQLALPSASVARIQSSGQYTILKSLNAGVRFLEFNTTQAPFTDLRVRRALNYAIDKQAVVQVVLSGLGVPISGVLSPAMYGYWPGISAYAPSYNAARAVALLKQAGYSLQNGQMQRGGKPLVFTAVSSTLPVFKQSALVVQDQLKRIGVTMTIQTQEFATEIATIRKGQSQADFLGYNYPIPDIFYLWFHSSQIGTGFADSFYRDPALDALIVKMRTTADTAQRDALIVRLERYVSDRALWIPLWDEYNYIAFQPRVKGAFLDPRGRVILNDAAIG